MLSNPPKKSRRHFINTAAGLGLTLPNLIRDAHSEATKKALRILNPRPFNAETPMHLLDTNPTPTHLVFVRNNGITPAEAPKDWKLEIFGEIKKEKSFTLNELKKNFKHYNYQLTLECGGNGRAGFFPKVSGNQWSYGAIACPVWNGIKLKDLLLSLGIKKQLYI